MTTWTKIPKATGTGWTKIPKATGIVTNVFTGGDPIGLLLALTKDITTQTITDPWTKIPKATGTGWTKIPKAT